MVSLAFTSSFSAVGGRVFDRGGLAAVVVFGVLWHGITPLLGLQRLCEVKRREVCETSQRGVGLGRNNGKTA